MTTQNIFDLVDTWALSGGPYTSIKMNATDNDAASASLLMDLQVGTVSKFKVSKGGAITATGFSNFGTSLTGAGQFIGGAYTSDGASTIGISLSWNTAGTLGVISSGTIGFVSSATDSRGIPDALLTRRGIANLRLGAADTTATTAPTAQFLSAQSWSSSTTNDQLGANFTIDGSQGTGQGAGGSIIFRVAPAGGTSNGVQNGLSAALTISDAGQFTVTRIGSTASPYGTLATFQHGSSAWLTGLAYGGGGYAIFASNNVQIGGPGSNQNYGISLAAGTPIGWTSSTNGPNTALDVTLFRDAANTLALRNGTTAQEMRVYETTTGTIYKAILGNRQLIKIAGAAFDNGAGASAGTLTNAPAVGNPTKWIPIDDNGTTRHIPAW